MMVFDVSKPTIRSDGDCSGPRRSAQRSRLPDVEFTRKDGVPFSGDLAVSGWFQLSRSLNALHAGHHTSRPQRLPWRIGISPSLPIISTTSLEKAPSKRSVL